MDNVGVLAMASVGAAALVRTVLAHNGIKDGWLSWLLPVLAAAAVGFVGQLMISVVSRPTVDEAMAQFKSVPLVGVMLANEPGAEQKLREQLAASANAPNKEASDAAMIKARAIVQGLRTQYIAPAFRKASDQNIRAVWDAFASFVQYLQTSNTRLCKEFFSSGINNVNELDQTGNGLFLASLKAEERAYLNGRLQQAEQATIDMETFRSALAQLGFSSADLQNMGQLQNLTDNAACSLAVRYYAGARQLPAGSDVSFMRTALSAQ